MAVGGTTTAERNIITVLAVDMVGSTRHIAGCDPDEAQAFLDRWLDHIRGSVERLGGQIVHYAGDGGIAIFGWPTAYEDHADRACIAAWDIQGHTVSTGPGGHPVNFRVGVHSGLVGLRKGGRNAIYRFDVAGATVHVAAKLQQEATPGEVRVSAETAKLCKSPLDLTACKMSSGIADRVFEVYRLNARPKDVDQNDVARRYQHPIVNRVDELAALRERLPRWGGKSCSVALLGEPGIGKSRLATAAMTDALTSDVRCCVFYGAVQRRVTAFAAARALVGDMLDASSLSSDDHFREALAALGVEAGDRKTLETLFFVGKSPSRQRLSDNTQTQIARALVAAFLALALSRPTLLLIEDLQWIDPESRHFLKLLARANSPQPLCILLTGRPESANEAADIAESIIHLQPLSRPDMEALGRQLWAKDRPPAVLERAIDRADGVPFILEEFLRSADATNAMSGQSLPQSVESVIHARLQRLSAKIKTFALARRQGRAAQVSSIQSLLGMVYWFEGRYEEGLQVTSEGLRTARALGSPALIFSNQTIMANVLHGMGRVDRAIAEMDELNEMLTGELETARLGTPAGPKCTVLAFRSWFMNATGQYGEALEFASRALDIATRELDLYGEVLARITMGRNLLMLHRNDEAVECLSIGKAIVERNGYDTINANLTGALATALARTGKAHQAVGLAEACMESGMHLRTGQMEVCYLYVGYAEALVRSGESERGVSALERALSIAKTINNPWLTVECLGLRARLLAETKPDAPRVTQDLAEIRAICDQYGVVAWDVSRLVA
jgi:class 3 adenylate cyclase/tetratricopeptide (TPR) repeat protein